MPIKETHHAQICLDFNCRLLAVTTVGVARYQARSFDRARTPMGGNYAAVDGCAAGRHLTLPGDMAMKIIVT
jgi:hypothetical protein